MYLKLATSLIIHTYPICFRLQSIWNNCFVVVNYFHDFIFPQSKLSKEILKVMTTGQFSQYFCSKQSLKLAGSRKSEVSEIMFLTSETIFFLS